MRNCLIQILFLLLFSQCNFSNRKSSAVNKKGLSQEEDSLTTLDIKYPKTKIISQWRGLNRNGIYPDENLLEYWPEEGPNILWKYDSLGVGYASPAVTKDFVYTVATLNDTSYIIGFSHQGKILWKEKMGAEFMDNYPGSRGTPIICNDYGYYFSGLGVLYCFDIKNGNPIWEKDIKKEYNGKYAASGYSENLIIDNDKVICAPTGDTISVVALNRFTGNLIWQSKGKAEQNAYANPIIIERDNKKIFVIQFQEAIVGIDIANGQRLWDYPMESKIHSNTPYYKDGFILAIDEWRGQTIKLELSLDGNSVSEVWKSPKLAAEQGDVVILGDRIFGADVADKSFNCVDWQTGRLLYKITRKNKPLRIATICADSLLYCYSSEGYFYLVNPLENKFETRGKFKVPGNNRYHYAHPVIFNGRLYVRHDNNLFVYDIKS